MPQELLFELNGHFACCKRFASSRSCPTAGYDAVDHPVPERLAALLKELKGRRY
jgi:hypothetical protein